MKNSVQPGRLFHPAHLLDSSESIEYKYSAIPYCWVDKQTQ